MRPSLMLTAVAALGLWAAATLGLSAAAAAGEARTFLHGKEQRSYLLHVPAKAPPEGAPLVLALHGGASNGAVMERFTGLSDVADAMGFVVAYPEGSGRFERLLAWNAGRCCGAAAANKVDDSGFLAELIDHLVVANGVDPARVYVTGMSNGAMMAYRLAAEHPERIAAVAAVAGGLEVPADTIVGPVPVLHIHGTADAYAPFNGGLGPKSITGTPFTSVGDTVAAWVRVNHAQSAALREPLPDRFDDGTRVTLYHYKAQEPGSAEVMLYEVAGGGHSWPGRRRGDGPLGAVSMDISANQLIWEFFARHRR